MIQSRMLVGRLLPLVGAAIAAMALVVPAASAAEPAPGYEQFAGCPSPEEVAVAPLCARTVIDGGHFQMGSKDVPITNPITLSGGIDATGHLVANAKGGLSPVKQKVPGGVVGLTGLTWLLELFGSEALTLYAVTELAGAPGSPFEEPLKLPIKVHLINPAGLLGDSCYVGSVSNPINLNLTTGTTSPPPPNEPITGVNPPLEYDAETRIYHLDDGTWVDNSFAAPGANGCKLVLFGFIPVSINGLVNSQSSLPAPAGTNETVQDFDIELAEREAVYP